MTSTVEALQNNHLGNRRKWLILREVAIEKRFKVAEHSFVGGQRQLK